MHLFIIESMCTHIFIFNIMTLMFIVYSIQVINL